MAVALDNRAFARFLYDAMMFETLPYWAPAVAAGALVTTAFVFVEVSGRCCCVLVCWVVEHL